MTRNELYELWGNPQTVVVHLGASVPMRDKVCALDHCKQPLKREPEKVIISLDGNRHYLCGRCVSQGRVRV